MPLSAKSTRFGCLKGVDVGQLFTDSNTNLSFDVFHFTPQYPPVLNASDNSSVVGFHELGFDWLPEI